MNKIRSIATGDKKYLVVYRNKNGELKSFLSNEKDAKVHVEQTNGVCCWVYNNEVKLEDQVWMENGQLKRAIRFGGNNNFLSCGLSRLATALVGGIAV